MFMFSKYFLRILKICLPFKPYRIYEFKSEWKPFSKIGTIHYCKDWIRSSIQTIRISTGHHFTVFTVVIGFSILRSKLTPKTRDSKNRTFDEQSKTKFLPFCWILKQEWRGLVLLDLVVSLVSHSKYENCINLRWIRPFLKYRTISRSKFSLSEKYHRPVRLGQAWFNIL